MKNRVIYYPRIQRIYFYNNGILCGGMMGSIARTKFWRLVKSGVFPRISLAKEAKVVCE